MRAIGIAVGLTTVVLTGLALADFFGNRTLFRPLQDPLQVKVTAHQWWWEIEYLDSQAAGRVITANQLTLPVGRPVLLQMTSGDVIHSFWVPSLNGKKDLLPGYSTTLALMAARAGQFRGECAEFCGFQHAHMGIDIDAQPADQFTRWLDAQRAPAAEPPGELERRGQDVFMSSTCRACHAVQGTGAAARLGPDLTHLASRPRIAAGARPNDAANLAAWILDPQSIKPGSRMPPTSLKAEDLTALVAWLGTLR
jgi:cytochrome c oxidase subunit 2